MEKPSCSPPESTTVPVHLQLRRLFGFTQEEFDLFHAEVTVTMSTVLPLKMKDVMRKVTTVNLTSAILDDVLSQLNSALVEVCERIMSHHLPVRSSREIAEELIFSTANKMQEFWPLCAATGWRTLPPGPPVKSQEEQDASLSRAMVEAASGFLEMLLTIFSEGTSAQEFGADAPLCRLIQAVVENMKASPKSSEEIQFTSDETSPVEKHLSTASPRGQKPGHEEIRERVSFSSLAEVKDQEELRLSYQTFQDEASKLICSIIMKETSAIAASRAATKKSSWWKRGGSKVESCTFSASSRVVHFLATEVKNLLDEDFELADPSFDPARYQTQVELVCEKILKRTRAKVQEAFVTNLLVRQKMAMSSKECADFTSRLMSNSIKLVRSIVLRVREFSSHSKVRGIVRSTPVKDFLKSMKLDLECWCFLPMSQVTVQKLMPVDFVSVLAISPRSHAIVWESAQKSAQGSSSAAVCGVRSGKKHQPGQKKSLLSWIRSKIRKQKEEKKIRAELKTSQSSKQRQKKPVPPVVASAFSHRQSLFSRSEEPSTSQADSTPTAISGRKKESLLSRLSKIFSRVCRK